MSGEMKNELVKFVCGVEDHVLHVSIYRGKKDIHTMCKWKTPDGKTKTGCRAYFELHEVDEAQKAFKKLLKEAEEQGWKVLEKTQRSTGFNSIPAAPKPASSRVSQLATPASGKK